MRLYKTYCLNAGSTLAKVEPDTNVKFCEAETIRGAFSNPHPKHPVSVYSLDTKGFKNKETDIYGAQWLWCAHSNLRVLITAFTILPSPPGVPTGHPFDQSCDLGRDTQRVIHKGWATPVRYQPSESTLESPDHLMRSILHSHLSGMSTPQFVRITFWLKCLGPMADAVD